MAVFLSCCAVIHFAPKFDLIVTAVALCCLFAMAYYYLCFFCCVSRADVNYPNAIKRSVATNGYVEDLTDECTDDLTDFSAGAGRCGNYAPFCTRNLLCFTLCCPCPPPPTPNTINSVLLPALLAAPRRLQRPACGVVRRRHRLGQRVYRAVRPRRCTVQEFLVHQQ